MPLYMTLWHWSFLATASTLVDNLHIVQCIYLVFTHQYKISRGILLSDLFQTSAKSVVIIWDCVIRADRQRLSLFDNGSSYMSSLLLTQAKILPLLVELCHCPFSAKKAAQGIKGVVFFWKSLTHSVELQGKKRWGRLDRFGRGSEPLPGLSSADSFGGAALQLWTCRRLQQLPFLRLEVLNWV